MTDQQTGGDPSGETSNNATDDNLRQPSQRTLGQARQRYDEPNELRLMPLIRDLRVPLLEGLFALIASLCAFAKPSRLITAIQTCCIIAILSIAVFDFVVGIHDRFSPAKTTADGQEPQAPQHDSTEQPQTQSVDGVDPANRTLQ